MMLVQKIFQPLTSSDVCGVYELLYEHGLVSFPLVQDAAGRIGAVVDSIIAVHFGHAIYASLEEKAVAYLYFLIKDHPFVDGNKRTAVIVFMTVCAFNKLKPDFSVFTLDELAVYIEQRQGQDYHSFIATIATALFA